MSEENVNPSMPDLSGIMDIISKNPDLVSKAASIIEEMKKDGGIPQIGGLDVGSLGAVLPALKPTDGGGKSGKESAHRGSRSCELLRALKPYLSKERCDAIDYMLNLGKIGDILGAIAPKDGGGKNV